MSNTYSWQFPRLDVYPTYQTLADAVFQVHWIMYADDGLGHSAKAYGVEHCGPIDPIEFIPYADLTEEEVRGWVETQLGTDGINAIKVYLDQKISEIISPTEVSMPPPWL